MPVGMSRSFLAQRSLTDRDQHSRSSIVRRRLNNHHPWRIITCKRHGTPATDSRGARADLPREVLGFVRVAYGITRDREAALDAVQETFAAALRNRRAFRGEGPVEGWLWRSLVNNALKSRPRPSPQLDINATVALPPEPDGLSDPIRRLPERQRLVLFLRYYADLDYRTIATTAGITVGTVSATLSAAHDSLRSAIEEVR